MRHPARCPNLNKTKQKKSVFKADRRRRAQELSVQLSVMLPLDFLLSDENQEKVKHRELEFATYFNNRFAPIATVALILNF